MRRAMPGGPFHTAIGRRPPSPPACGCPAWRRRCCCGPIEWCRPFLAYAEQGFLCAMSFRPGGHRREWTNLARSPQRLSGVREEGIRRRSGHGSCSLPPSLARLQIQIEMAFSKLKALLRKKIRPPARTIDRTVVGRRRPPSPAFTPAGGADTTSRLQENMTRIKSKSALEGRGHHGKKIGACGGSSTISKLVN